MAKPLLVVVEKEESYLTPLEMKLAEMLWDSVDMEIISEAEYFEEYFIQPKKIDVLVIDESMYNERLRLHNIDKTYILTESLSAQDDLEHSYGEIVHLYKFCALNVLIGYIVQPEWGGCALESAEPEVIAFVSPSGGSGSTTLSLGVSACMRQNMKKALYMNINNYQNFHFLLQSKVVLPMDACTEMQRRDNDTFEKIKKYLIKNEFTYLPPLRSSRDSLGIAKGVYSVLVQAAKKTKEFDYIIVDIGNELNTEAFEILGYANKVFIVTQQDEFSAFKMNLFRKCVNCDDLDKFIVVCNCFESDKKNSLVGTNTIENLVVNSYIEKNTEAVETGSIGLAEMEDIQKLAYMLM